MVADLNYVSVQWGTPTSDGGSPITGYNIYASSRMGGEGTTPVATVSASTDVWADPTVTASQTFYYFTVAAVNANGVGTMSRELVGTRNLVRNPSFETNTNGWNGKAGGSVSQASPSVGDPNNDTGWGSYVARVTQQPGYSEANFNDSPNTVPSTMLAAMPSSGLECQLWVAARSSVVGAKLKDRIRQYSSTGTLLGYNTSDAQTITSASWPAGNNGMWNFYSADYIVKPGGGSLDLNVIGQNLGTGGSYDVDDVELTCDTNPNN